MRNQSLTHVAMQFRKKMRAYDSATTT